MPTDVKPRILTTNIDLDNGSASLDLALSVAENFRLTLADGKTIIKEVGGAVSEWRKLAFANDLSEREIERMASAFVHEDSEFAASL